MVNHKPLDEIIASDLSWRTDFERRTDGVGLRNMFSYARHECGLSTDIVAAKEIANRVLAFQDGDVADPIAEGELIPVPEEKSRRVIKIVQDSRILLQANSGTVIPANKALLEALVDGGGVANRGYEFERDANRLLDKDKYLDGRALSFVPFKGIDACAYVERRVFYARGGQTLPLVMVDSEDIQAASNGMLVPTLPLGNVRVGAAFKRERPRSNNRIVSVKELEPTGVVWDDPNPNNGDANPNKRKRKLKQPVLRASPTF